MTPPERLIAQAQRGSMEAFAGLVGLHQQAVRSFLRRLTGNHADADDLAQETFVAAWNKLQRFAPGHAVRPWLCGIAYRKFLAERRSRRRALAREAVAAEGQALSANPGPGADQRLDLAKALQALSDEQRAVIALCLAADFSHSEAASALDIPLGTVKSHIQRGRDKLLVVLGDSYE